MQADQTDTIAGTVGAANKCEDNIVRARFGSEHGHHRGKSNGKLPANVTRLRRCSAAQSPELLLMLAIFDALPGSVKTAVRQTIKTVALSGRGPAALEALLALEELA